MRKSHIQNIKNSKKIIIKDMSRRVWIWIMRNYEINEIVLIKLVKRL